MGRPNKREQRSGEVLDAAIRVIDERGLDGLHLRDIATEMDLTENAIRYYFKSIEDLIAALAARSDPRFDGRRREEIRQLEDPAEQLAALIRDGLPRGVEDTEWRVIWAAVLAAGFRLDERADVQGIFHRQVRLYADVLRSGAERGAFRLSGAPEDLARALLSIEDNLGYRIAARDPEVNRADALRVMVAAAEAFTGAELPPIV